MTLKKATRIAGLTTLGIILIILLILCLPVGVYGGLGPWGYGPGVIVLIVLLLRGGL
jgi:hypothetical protein